MRFVSNEEKEKPFIRILIHHGDLYVASYISSSIYYFKGLERIDHTIATFRTEVFAGRKVCGANFHG